MLYDKDPAITAKDRNDRGQNIRNTLDSSYYTSHRIPVLLRSREIGKAFVEVNDNLVVVAGENTKEHEYFIPKSEVSHYDETNLC